MRGLGIRIAVLVAGIVVGAVGEAAGQVRIGVSAPITGQLAGSGMQIVWGAEQAVEDLNAGGGLLGQKVELVTYDDQCSPPLGHQHATRLVTVEKVALVIGPTCTQVALAALRVYGAHQNSVIAILSAATASPLTEQGYSNVFRVVPRATRQGPVIADYLRRITGYRFAVLNDGSAYAAEVDAALREAWSTLAASASLQAGYSPAAADYNGLIGQLRGADIKVAYAAGSPIAVGNLVRQARAAGLSTLFVGSEASASPQLWSIAGGSAEGMMLTFFPDPARNPQTAALVNRLQHKGHQSSVYALYAYGAIEAFAQAARRADSIDAARVASVLHSQDLPTVLGRLAFDAKGDERELGYVFYRWQSGNLVQMNDRPPPPPPPP